MGIRLSNERFPFNEENIALLSMENYRICGNNIIISKEIKDGIVDILLFGDTIKMLVDDNGKLSVHNLSLDSHKVLKFIKRKYGYINEDQLMKLIIQRGHLFFQIRIDYFNNEVVYYENKMKGDMRVPHLYQAFNYLDSSTIFMNFLNIQKIINFIAYCGVGNTYNNKISSNRMAKLNQYSKIKNNNLNIFDRETGEFLSNSNWYSNIISEDKNIKTSIEITDDNFCDIFDSYTYNKYNNGKIKYANKVSSIRINKIKYIHEKFDTMEMKKKSEINRIKIKSTEKRNKVKDEKIENIKEILNSISLGSRDSIKLIYEKIIYLLIERLIPKYNLLDITELEESIETIDLKYRYDYINLSGIKDMINTFSLNDYYRIIYRNNLNRNFKGRFLKILELFSSMRNIISINSNDDSNFLEFYGNGNHIFISDDRNDNIDLLYSRNNENHLLEWKHNIALKILNHEKYLNILNSVNILKYSIYKAKAYSDFKRYNANILFSKMKYTTLDTLNYILNLNWSNPKNIKDIEFMHNNKNIILFNHDTSENNTMIEIKKVIEFVINQKDDIIITAYHSWDGEQFKLDNEMENVIKNVAAKSLNIEVDSLADSKIIMPKEGILHV